MDERGGTLDLSPVNWVRACLMRRAFFWMECMETVPRLSWVGPV